MKKDLDKVKIKFRNDQHSMFPTMLDSCELNNVFSTNFSQLLYTNYTKDHALYELKTGFAVSGPT